MKLHLVLVLSPFDADLRRERQGVRGGKRSLWGERFSIPFQRANKVLQKL